MPSTAACHVSCVLYFKSLTANPSHRNEARTPQATSKVQSSGFHTEVYSTNSAEAYAEASRKTKTLLKVVDHAPTPSKQITAVRLRPPRHSLLHLQALLHQRTDPPTQRKEKGM